MNKNLLFFLLIVFAVIGCDDSESNFNSFYYIILSDTHVRIPDNPDDIHYNNQKNLDNLTAAVQTINAEYSDAAFVIVTGDLVGCLFLETPSGYTGTPEDPAARFKSIMDTLTIPYYPILGNHDYQISFDMDVEEGISTTDLATIEEYWKGIFNDNPLYDNYYSLVHNGYRFILLNSNRGDRRNDVCLGCSIEQFCKGSFDSDQMDWFEAQLQNPEPVFLFFHHPVHTDNSEGADSDFQWSAAGAAFLIDSNDRFYSIAETYKEKIKAIFVGHGHFWAKDTLNETIKVYETQSIGDTNGNRANMHIVYVYKHRFELGNGNEFATYNRWIPVE